MKLEIQIQAEGINHEIHESWKTNWKKWRREGDSKALLSALNSQVIQAILHYTVKRTHTRPHKVGVISG